MALTDLTGTKWRWNSNLVLGEDLTAETYELNFNSNLHSYTILDMVSGIGEEPGEEFINALYYDTMPLEGNAVYGVSPDIPETYIWYDEAYRLIEITGGTDATNATLIALLQSNAEQIIDSPVLPSFSDVEVTPHDGYITMTINGVDFNLKTAASVSLISFSVTIRGSTPSFNAEEGMTWAEWVASEYNTAGFSISGSNVVNTDLVVTYDGSAVSPSDVIIAHTIYYTATGD